MKALKMGVALLGVAFGIFVFIYRFLGSGLIGQSQKMTVAAMQMADMNV